MFLISADCSLFYYLEIPKSNNRVHKTATKSNCKLFQLKQLNIFFQFNQVTHSSMSPQSETKGLKFKGYVKVMNKHMNKESLVIAGFTVVSWWQLFFYFKYV